MDADGTGQTRITDNEANEWRTVWSPDGNQFVFTSDRNGNDEIYIMDVDGSNPTRITDDPGIDINASWIPNGSGIIFNSNRSGNHEIYIMEISSNHAPGVITRLTENSVDDGHPVWMPIQ